jgi:AcrR family transcriptional regulator
MEGRDLRAEIIDTARRLFIEHGYRGLAMREIAAAIGVSKPALYYHFRDKEDLFLAILTEYLEELTTLIEEISKKENPCREQVREIISAILSQPGEKRSLIRLGTQEVAQVSEQKRQSFNEAYQKGFIDKLEAILQRGMKAGELRSIDVRIATWALLGIVYPYLYPTEIMGERPLEELINNLTSVYFEGVGR